MYLKSPFIPETNVKPLHKKKIVLTNISASLRSLERKRKQFILGLYLSHKKINKNQPFFIHTPIGKIFGCVRKLNYVQVYKFKVTVKKMLYSCPGHILTLTMIGIC